MNYLHLFSRFRRVHDRDRPTDRPRYSSVTKGRIYIPERITAMRARTIGHELSMGERVPERFSPRHVRNTSVSLNPLTNRRRHAVARRIAIQLPWRPAHNYYQFSGLRVGAD